MAPMSEEDLAWFRSTFRPIPRPQLPDDAIEYSIYLFGNRIPGTTNTDNTISNVAVNTPKTTGVNTDAVLETRSRLQNIQKTASQLSRLFLKDYIWQREGFGLELTKEDGTSLLRGRTNFGDSIEDEWVIVFLLRELSRKHCDIWIKVVDSDGEFLLIEAAGSLPSWLEPEVADNRVWINDGELVIIKPKHDRKSITEKISVCQAKEFITKEPKRLMRSPMIQEEAFYRLRNYPQQINDNLHCALITVPRKVAYLLHQKPAYISPAVESFYIRDPIALRPLKTGELGDLLFPPEDLVTVSIRFTRVGYAQLKSQEFPTPKAWVGILPPVTGSKNYSCAEMGMKVASGLEMLLRDPQTQDRPTVREIKLLLEDIESGDERLPTDEEILKLWPKREDDEGWLDISFEDLDQELHGKGKSSKTGNFGDTSAQENLQRIVAQFEKFLNDDSAGFGGVDPMVSSEDEGEHTEDSDDMSSDGEDKEASFDEAEFSRMMEDMMGITSETGRRGYAPFSRTLSKVQEIDSETEEVDIKEIEKLSQQMEAELRPTGVLDLTPSIKATSSKKMSIKGKVPVQRNTAPNVSADEDDTSEQANLAENLLESLQSQAGLSGPAGNLLGMMGVKTPQFDHEQG